LKREVYEYALRLGAEAYQLHQSHLTFARGFKDSFDYKKAIEHYEAAIKHNPNVPEAWAQLADCWMNVDQFDNAQACYKQALRLNPTLIGAMLGYADTMSYNERPQDALKVLERARALIKPGTQEAKLYPIARGNACFIAGDLKGAERAFRDTIAQDPAFGAGYGSLANVLNEQGRHEEAWACYVKAYQLVPEPRYGMNIALHGLLTGRYEEGWKHWECRLESLHRDDYARFKGKPRWDGEAPGALYVWTEQGLGDLIQFSRYLPLLKARGNRVILEVYPNFMSYALTLPGVDEVVPRTPDLRVLHKYDHQQPLMSLPLTLKLWSPEQSPGYGVAEKQLTEARSVALSWYGNPDHENDRNRSMKLKELAGLVRQFPGIHWFTVLPEPRAAEDIAKLGLPIEQRKGTIVEAEGWLRDADLLITVDTSHAHLAGKAGTPTWLLLPFNPDWRWGVTGERTAWYPSLRILRQTKRGRWTTVVDEVSKRLEAAKA